ncbi:MAG TPA: hypothetical protein VMR41_04740 [Patescibacteria group bacterium]|nr:hypothetical protein [Patescibacteria group bacterium]
MNNDNVLPEDITWEEIQKYLDNDPYQEFLKQIPLLVYKMATDKNNRPKVIEAVMQALQERDPQNATEAYASKMADRMEEMARMVLATRQKK